VPYGYDANDEVTSAGSTTYSDDANGNRVVTSGGIGPDNRLEFDNDSTYKYDREGNLTNKISRDLGANPAQPWRGREQAIATSSLVLAYASSSARFPRRRRGRARSYLSPV
jgi:hypothetical protein